MSEAAALAPVILRPWPRLLGAPEAAAYLGISVSKLLAGVKAEPPRYPQPIRDGGNVLWDIKALDAHVDALAGLIAPSPALKASGVKKWGAS